VTCIRPPRRPPAAGQPRGAWRDQRRRDGPTWGRGATRAMANRAHP